MRKILVLLCVALGVIALGPVGGMGAPPAFAQDAGTAGVAVGTTSAGAGELVVYGTDTQFLPRAVISVGLLYPDALNYTANCKTTACQAEQAYFDTQCGGLGAGTAAKLTTAWDAWHTSTADTDMQLLAMKEHWQANTVRFHVSQGALAYEEENGLSQYTDAVLSVIEQARAMGLVVIVDVDTEPYSCTPDHSYPAGGSGTVRLPTGKTKEAWDQLTPALGNDPGVILEPMNEPSTTPECGNPKGNPDWSQWATGCGSPDIGMVNLGNWLRTQAPYPAGVNTGVSNVLLFDGDNNAGTFIDFPGPSSLGMPSNSAYGVHPLSYGDGPTGWDTRFGVMEEPTPSNGGPPGGQGLAVVADAWNELNCSDTQPLGNQLVQQYLPQHNIGLALEGWDPPASTLATLPLSTSNPASGDPITSITQTCNNVTGPWPTGADVAYAQYWLESGASVPTTAVQVSPPLTWKNGVVDAVSAALASNGSAWPSTSTPPDVVSAVDLRVQKGCSGASTWVQTMQVLNTGAWWDNGSFSTASASNLSAATVTAQAGDCLIFRVYYQGVSGYTDTVYTVPRQS